MERRSLRNTLPATVGPSPASADLDNHTRSRSQGTIPCRPQADVQFDPDPPLNLSLRSPPISITRRQCTRTTSSTENICFPDTGSRPRFSPDPHGHFLRDKPCRKGRVTGKGSNEVCRACGSTRRWCFDPQFFQRETALAAAAMRAAAAPTRLATVVIISLVSCATCNSCAGRRDGCQDRQHRHSFAASGRSVPILGINRRENQAVSSA